MAGLAQVIPVPPVGSLIPGQGQYRGVSIYIYIYNMITAGYLPTLGGNPLETSGIYFFFNFFFKKNLGKGKM